MTLRIAAFLVAVFLALTAIPAFRRAERLEGEGRSTEWVRLELARAVLAIVASGVICVWLLRSA